MVLKYPDRHLSDQEFFTHIKLFEFIFGDKTINADEDSRYFELSDLKIGNDDDSDLFGRICLGGQLLGLTVTIGKDHGFEEEVEKAKEEIAKKPIKERKALVKLLADIGELLEQTTTKRCRRSWMGFRRSALNWKNTPKAITTIKPL